MTCSYCGGKAILSDSALIYGKSYGYVWVCEHYPICGAYVGCHPGTKNPLGTLADAELRTYRNRAHELFDPLWRTHKMSRSKAYAWLSSAMQIHPDQCHIGMFNITQCKQLILLFERNQNKMANNKNTQLTTNEVRISYEHLVKPYAQNPTAEEKYSVTLLIPKADIMTKQHIDAAIQAAIQEGISGKWNGVRPPQVAIPLHDGDGVRPNGEAFGPECKGCWVMTASSTQRQDIVDLNLQPIIDATQIYSGMYCRVNINFFAYFNSGKKGIGCGLGPVQKTRDGEPLGGRISAADAFGAAAPAQPQYQQAPTPQYAPPQYAQQQYPQIDPITGLPM